MKREQLEKYLKEKVKIILFDGDEQEEYLKRILVGASQAENISGENMQ